MPFNDPEKKKARDKAYRAAHQEERRTYAVVYHAAHPEERKAHDKAYRAAHREEQRAYSVVYSAAHREEQRAYSVVYSAAHQEERRAYRAAHRQERNAYMRAYRAAHPEERRVIRARRRARKKMLPATLTTEQWKAIKQAYRKRCAYCGLRENATHPLTQDHVVPISHGGGTTSENIVPACLSCNSRKKAGPPALIPATRLML